MIKAMRTTVMPDAGLRPPANDNDCAIGDTEADRWHWIICRLKAIHMPAAVQAAALKLEGMSAEEFVQLMCQAVKTLGWTQAPKFVSSPRSLE